MGIQGLIPFLEKASSKVNIGQYAGCCVAIDAYCWLHKGAYTCVEKLARGEPCDAYVHYCMKFINMLLAHNIKPILVFDGQHLPAKAVTEKKRRESRHSSRKRAAELLRAGRPDEARNFLRRCIDITHDMALALIHECRRRNVDCIVAPYEADAQLAYLNLKNIAQIVITEDSDLVLFGCTKILFKMDLAGNGLLVEQERLHLAMGIRPENFSFDKFRYMCILSGCDYLPSLPGIGLVKACKFIKRTADPDIHKALSRLPAHLNMKSLTVPEEYRNEFVLADATFQYQLVFDPQSRRLVHLNEPLGCEKVTDYAGKMLSHDIAYQLALGNLNPFTLQKVDGFNPDVVQQPQKVKTMSWAQVRVAPHASIWSRAYKVPAVCLKQDPRQVDRPSTKGKVLKKEIAFDIEPRRQYEDDSDSCTDADLTSMYFTPSTQSQPSKRKRSDSCNLDECEIDKENSAVNTPTKQAASVTDEQASTECASEVTPVKQSLPNRLTSPVLTTGRSKRNPFFKQTHPESPRKDPTDSSTNVCGTEGSQEKKFSALSKFGRLRRTEIDGTTIVQSRFFSKQKNPETKITTQATENESEQNLQSNVELKDVSNTLNTSDNMDLLGVRNCKTDSPSKQSPVKSDNALNPDNHKATDAASLLATFEADGRKLSCDSPTKECIVERDELHTSDQGSKDCSGNSVKTLSTGTKSLSKSFTWCHSRFGFQKCKSAVTLDKSAAVKEDFKSPSVETVSASMPLSLSVEEEDEDLVDDPSPVDSGVDLGTLSSPGQQADSFTASKDSVTIDEGFHSPSSSHLSRSLGSKSKANVCRRPGLSKSSSMAGGSGKQQSLLSMFGFQKKSKLQHT